MSFDPEDRAEGTGEESSQEMTLFVQDLLDQMVCVCVTLLQTRQ